MLNVECKEYLSILCKAMKKNVKFVICCHISCGTVLLKLAPKWFENAFYACNKTIKDIRCIEGNRTKNNKSVTSYFGKKNKNKQRHLLHLFSNMKKCFLIMTRVTHELFLKLYTSYYLHTFLSQQKLGHSKRRVTC